MTPLQNHQDRQYQPNVDENSTKIDAEIMTFGPNNEWREAWKDILLWARRHDVDKTLNLLIDTFNLQGSEIKDIPFRNIIDILAHDHSLQLLKSWAVSDPVSADLYRLATTARTEFELNQGEFHKNQRAKDPPREKLPVKQYYLTLLFLKDMPFNKAPEDTYWLLTMQIWLLVHAIYKAEQHIYFSPNIQGVSSYLRKLIEEHLADWSSFSRLKPSSEETSSLISLNTHLIQRIPALREINRNKDKSFQDFLGAIERIATNEEEEATNYSSSSLTPLYINTHIDNSLVINEKDEEWLPYLPVFPDPEGDSEDGSESGDSYAETPVDNNDSYIHQKLSAKSRLIAHAEHLSHLPWSWDRPTPSELIELSLWIRNSWENNDKEMALLAAFVWIATNTGRTLVRTLDLPINIEPQKEWTLTPDGSALRRIPPVRENPWLPKTPEEHHWIEPMAAFNEIVLPPKIQKTLNSLGGSVAGSALYLANYWKKVSMKDIEVSFNKMMTGSLNRLKSGMLANILSQNTFELTNNSHLAQMVGGHPQLALTGAFAYGSWSCLKVHKATADIHRCLDEYFEPLESQVIAFGSRVNPREALLQKAIKDASQKLLEMDNQINPIEFHNAYVSYLMVSLWAATGARPVIDSFESTHHFNLDAGFVFVNDKACDMRRMGRLVPLPSSICNQLQDGYTAHLTLLAESIKHHNKALSHEINLILNSAPSGRLPYLFHINAATLDWESISPSEIDRQDLFHWPLRHNLFRQRFAKRLPDLGVPTEVVDAWLGHKDAGMDSYGDYSIRCWLDDLNSMRSSIDAAFDGLGFLTIPTWSSTPSIAPVDTPALTQRAFGIELRAINRQEQHDKIKQEAKLQIEAHLGGRKLDELDSNEIQELERRLATLPNGRSHPFALLKLSVLSKQVDDIWEEESERIQLSKRLMRLQDNFTNVKPSTPLYCLIFNELRVIFNSEYKETTPSRTGISESRLLVILALIFENRISYEAMLIDIFNQQNFRLVKYRRRFYLEYSETLDEGDYFTPVQRHLISSKTAHLLNNLLKLNRKQFKLPVLVRSITSKVNEFAPQLKFNEPDQIIRNLTEIVDQANSVVFPGTVAGFLSGRVRSCSLNWYDWVRLTQNKILHIPYQSKSQEPVDAIDSLLEHETHKYDASVIHITDKEQLQIEAKQFFDEIRGTLNEYKPSTRSETSKRLRNIISRYERKASSATVLVGRWIQEIIKKGKSKGGKAYASDSPLRYFSAISPTFEQIAYNKDLLLMYSESVTEFYSEFLSATQNHEGSYHADRLLSFHHYCRQEGVEDPDWDELDLPSSSRNVSTGIVTESDYFKSLDIILSQRKLSDDQRQHMALLLMLCFRFGLRSMEAIGLTRDDWIVRHECTYFLIKNYHILIINYPFIKRNNYILIMNNHIRTLKTDGSRRIIPLLFNLSGTEKRLITNVLSRYESYFHNIGNQSLFAEPGLKVNRDMEFIRHTLILILRKVTGNPKIVNHHLRHSFSNATSIALYHLELEPWERLMSGSFNKESIRSITLGTNQHASSRSSMAAARLLGHTHPRTDALSYQHFYGEWADTLVEISNKPTDKSLKLAVNLDKDFKISASISTKLTGITIEKYNAPTLSNLMRALSLVSNGKSFEASARMLYLDPKYTDNLAYVSACIGHKGIPKSSREGQINPDNLMNFQWLTRIRRKDWQELVQLSIELEQNRLPQMDNTTTIKIISDMIGGARQLTLWDEVHFINIQKFLSFFSIPMMLFDIESYHKETPVIELATRYGFEVNLDNTRADLDPGIEADSASGIGHENRINLIYKKGPKHTVKNSYHLTVCLIVFLITVMDNK